MTPAYPGPVDQTPHGPVVGMIAFSDPVTAARLAGIALIIGGVVLLNVGGAASHA